MLIKILIDDHCMKKAAVFLLFFSFISLVSCQSPYTATPPLDPVAKAYQKQQLRVQNQHKTIVGYKAGLTSQVGQAKFGVTQPIAGVLFKEGLSYERQVYLLNDYQRLMLETEIGFILKTDLPQFVIFPPDIRGFFDQAVAVIELPNLDFPNLSKVTGIDLITTNVASNHFLIGKPKPLNPSTINSITTELTRNGQTVIKGKATDAMGDQLVALRWLMMRLQSAGYSLKKGDILITGVLGKMIPAERGQYDADFSELGQLSFSIQ
ncbi:2-keto-4-pentenoate hydratase [Kangiella sp. TOML190]|uniref:2-keto-4-pentenoate hydratase n=1 Tax=Kangiella sp. TOML190 TaxID=2931351 RepID=UPI00203A7ECE|nr:4-oxalocrotonate decarboxylase [Kangiella sp. TOML190]